jgi:hypothetical protein
VSGLLFQAFRALGMGPSRRELALVAAVLRASGDAEAQALLGVPDDKGWERLIAIADDAGACGLVALDLATVFQTPDAFAHLMARPEDERVDDVPA